jgi:hypothetical protein
MLDIKIWSWVSWDLEKRVAWQERESGNLAISRQEFQMVEIDLKLPQVILDLGCVKKLHFL